MKVTEKDLIGEIENYPIEVVQKMCENQVAQGNEFNVKVFQKYSIIPFSKGGFDWAETLDGDYFWKCVIFNKNFDLFFEKYPKVEKANEYPKIMWVGRTELAVNSKKQKRVVFMEKCGMFLAWVEAENFEDAEKTYKTRNWKFAKDLDESDINPAVEMTLEQIEKELGKKIKLI
jgi:hypothetical protein